MHHNSFSTYFFKPIQINQNIEKGKAFITYWRSKLLRFGYNVEKENSLVPNREASSQTHQHVYQNHKNHQSKQHQLRFWNQNPKWVTLWKVEKGEKDSSPLQKKESQAQGKGRTSVLEGKIKSHSWEKREKRKSERALERREEESFRVHKRKELKCLSWLKGGL